VCCCDVHEKKTQKTIKKKTTKKTQIKIIKQTYCGEWLALKKWKKSKGKLFDRVNIMYYYRDMVCWYDVI
jgi:hypothetical protein